MLRSIAWGLVAGGVLGSGCYKERAESAEAALVDVRNALKLSREYAAEREDEAKRLHKDLMYLRAQPGCKDVVLPRSKEPVEVPDWLKANAGDKGIHNLRK
jgi:hypothetical protein